jgi:hypothetical protein
VVEKERLRLIRLARGSNCRLRREAYAELNPTPTTSSQSLLCRLLLGNGAVHQVRKSFGMPFDPSAGHEVLVTAFGRLFVSQSALKRLFPTRRWMSRLRTGLASARLLRQRRQVIRKWETEGLPRIERDVRLERSRDLSELDGPDLAWLLEQRASRFVEEHYVFAEEINLVAATQEAHLRQWLKKIGLGAKEVTFSTQSSITFQGDQLLQQVAGGKASLDDYLAEFGHRAVVDYELAMPRFDEDLTPVKELLSMLRKAPSTRTSRNCCRCSERLRQRGRPVASRPAT